MSVDCVILAAGLSSRMGKNKLTLRIGGKTVIEHCLSAFYDSCSRIVVVTGQYHEDTQRCLSPYSKVHIAYHGDYRQGMFSSVKEGVRHVESERFFLTPGDYPLLQSATILRMIGATGSFVVPVYKGNPGHPVLLDKLFVPIILRSDAASLRDCLREFSAKRRELCVDDAGVAADIDTMEEYNAAVESHRRKIRAAAGI